MHRSGLFFFNRKWYVVVLPFVLPDHRQSLRLSQPNNFADRQHARIHRAALEMLLGVAVVVSVPSVVSNSCSPEGGQMTCTEQ